LTSSEKRHNLTAALRALTAIGAAFASFLTDEAAAECGKTSAQTSPILLFANDNLLWWTLLILHRRALLIAIALLGWRTVVLLGVAAAVTLLGILGTALLIITLVRHVCGIGGQGIRVLITMAM